NGAQFGIGGAWSDGGKVINHPRIGIKFLVLVLRKIVRLGVVSQEIFAGCDRLGASKDFDEGRFAGAVDADQSYTIAALDEEAATVEHRVVAVALGDVLKLRHDSTARLRLGEAKMDGFFLGRNIDALCAL